MPTLQPRKIDEPLFVNALGIGLETPLGSRTIEVDNKPKPVSPFESRRVAGTIFGELSNTGGEEEARQILSTIVNRAKQKGVSFQSVISESNQYKAFRGEQYKKYMSGNLDYPSTKKAEIVDRVIGELDSNKFMPTTEKTGFKHLQGRILLDKDFGRK